MAITAVKIHPAIGVARLGNSPDEFFIGPERRWEYPNPPGGFKDAQCRVKRQAARFRLFAYHSDGSVQELTEAEAEISWTVHLASRKAITRNPGTPADLTIDPGPRTIAGANGRKLFDTGKIRFGADPAVTVPLGEIRTDNAARLLVLGGFGTSASPTSPPSPIGSFLNNAGWFDDISDGPVNATVKIIGSGEEFEAAGAWVLVGPPKFSPQMDNVITLYDTLLALAIDQGWQPAPGTPSYTDDIFPILKRAHDTNWVESVPLTKHAWTQPVYDPPTRAAIFGRLANPAGSSTPQQNMPRLNGGATLTKIQYQQMTEWKDGNFTQDWGIVPRVPAAQVTPADLDRSALDACVGAAFFPGIEAGGIAENPIITPANYLGAADPLRLNQAVLGPGRMSEFMALPWQADFKACGTQWWPVPRPNSVFPQGSTTRAAWDRDVLNMDEMVTEWHTLGFVVEQGAEFVEVDRCDTSFVALLTPHIVFQDVPQGPMGTARKVPQAIVFEVRSTGSPVTLELEPGSGPANARLSLAAASVTVGPTVGNAVATARLWLVYETGPVGEVIGDTLTIRNPADGRTWTVLITASTVARKTAAATLVLDRSGSMSEDRGDGQTKHQSLVEAASIFVDVMLEGDGIGLVRYNQDAQPLQPITALGAPDDASHTARQDTKNAITGSGLAPGGATSIGDGIFEGRQMLNAAGGAFEVKSLVVLTDGIENSARWIADVAGGINETTYAVGLGTPNNTSAPALQTLAGNHGGYLLVTGAITGDNQFVLQKYFLQILAGISNADVVLDPDGALVPGFEQRIPFLLTDADTGVDVILLTPHPKMVDFRLQTPNGFILEPWRAAAEPTMRHVMSDGVSYYRIVLPVELVPERIERAGRWHVLLTVGQPRLSRPSGPDAADRAGAAVPVAHGLPGVSARRFDAVPFSVIVHAYSDLSFRASLRQTGHEPGATAFLEARIAESGLPAAAGARVWAEIADQDGRRRDVALEEAEPGVFGGSFVPDVAGIYRCRLRASGRTAAGYPFEREQTLTVAVWKGGDRDADPDRPKQNLLPPTCADRIRACLASLFKRRDRLADAG